MNILDRKLQIEEELEELLKKVRKLREEYDQIMITLTNRPAQPYCDDYG